MSRSARRGTSSLVAKMAQSAITWRRFHCMVTVLMAALVRPIARRTAASFRVWFLKSSLTEV